MTATIIRFIDLLLVALLAGTTFGIWLGFDSAGLSATTYVELQQHAIRALNTLLPATGALCIALTLILAVAARRSPRARYLLIAAAACMVAAGVVTRFGNQPITAQVMTWVANAPPANWTEFRDWWWQWHTVRTVAQVAALALLILATNTDRSPSRWLRPMPRDPANDRTNAMEHALTTTGFEIDGFRITRNLGVVRGITVRSRSIFGTIGGSLQTIVGGNISLFTSLCERTRAEAFNLMLDHARQLGGNAVIGIRYDATDVMNGVTEVLCYGTAVVVEQIA